MEDRSSLTSARVVATVVPLALLAGAYAFQYVGGLFPCEMCWWQRYAHFVALGFAAVSWAMPQSRAPVALAGVAIALAAAIGAYHAGVEYQWWQGHTACTTTVAGGGDPLEAIMNAPLVRCDQVPWSLFGISMAGFNFLISSVAAGLIFVLLGRRRGPARHGLPA